MLSVWRWQRYQFGGGLVTLVSAFELVPYYLLSSGYPFPVPLGCLEVIELVARV